MRKQLANIITASRILCSICLLFCSVLSIDFYIMYLVCGFTDMLDGAAARKTKTVSTHGARFDTLSDIVFAAICLTKILPFMRLPTWLWIWIAMIATVKLGSIAYGFIHSKRLISLHTFWNKSTGFLLFLLPLTFRFIEPTYSSLLVCALATVAAINEIHYIRMGIEHF